MLGVAQITISLGANAVVVLAGGSIAGFACGWRDRSPLLAAAP